MQEFTEHTQIFQVIFGVLALIAGATSLLFPETLGHKMMTSLDEAESFYGGNVENRFDVVLLK